MNVIFDIQRIFADKYFVLILFSLRYKSFKCNFYNSYFLLVCGSNIAKKNVLLWMKLLRLYDSVMLICFCDMNFLAGW